MHNRILILKNQYQNCPYLVLSFPRCGRTWMKLLLGQYISKEFNVKFTKRLEKKRKGIPAILFRHDYMSCTGHLPWKEYFQIQKNKQLIFDEDMQSQKIIYLFRDPLDILFSFYPYLQTVPYTNFTPPTEKNIIDFAHNKEWGLDVVINFLNLMLDHYEKNTNKKLLIKYEHLKTNDNHWQKIIEFIFESFNGDNFNFAKQETEFKKLQSRDGHQKHFREGRSNYINDLPNEQQAILKNWPGLKELYSRMESI